MLLLFLGSVMLIGLLVGLIAEPGDYLASLVVPDLILPEWLFMPIWLLLCLAFAVAGWRMWLIDPTSVEMRLWLGVLVLSWWYGPVFFLIRSPPLALLVVLIMAALMLGFLIRSWHRDRVCALLFIPCLLWVGYVAATTAAIVAMN